MRRESRNFEIVMDQGTDLIQFYRENPCIAAYDLLGVDFAPIQRLIFEDMWFKDYTIAVASRGLGKTFLLGTLAALSCLLYPGYRAGLIASVFRQCPALNTLYSFIFFTNTGMKSSVKEFYESINELTVIQSLKSQNRVVNKCINNTQKCRVIKTTKGFEFAGALNHTMLVLDADLNLIYKKLDDLNETDNIVIKKGFNLFGNNDELPKFDFERNWRHKDCRIPKTLTPDLSYWFGLICGDGCIISKDNGKSMSVDFVNEDQDLLDYFKQYLSGYFVDDIEYIDYRKRRNNTYEIRYHGNKLCEFLLKCGLTKDGALSKLIPESIKKASKECVKSFLSGLMDTDGSCYVQTHNNGYKHCEVSLSTSSISMAKEVHVFFLNFGILSNFTVDTVGGERYLSGRDKVSKCATSYKVRITGIPDLIKFRDKIGFRCRRKAKKLNDYLTDYVDTKISNTNNIPNAASVVLRLAIDCRKLFKYGDKEIKILGPIINNVSNYKDVTAERVKLLLGIAKKYNILTKEYFKLKEIIDLDLSFVNIVKSKYVMDETIDVEVENEHCYFAGGFVNHNSKMIFSEVEKLYFKSPILREACEKKPIHAPDRCYLKFKSIGGANGSYIEALPLGVDGSKIRGSRFYLLLLDELAQIPDKTLDMVVRPMGATTLEPMENVRRLEKQNRLIELGLADEGDFEETTVNKMVMTSSGFYKFNHMWRRMKDHWRQMEEYGDESRYAVWQVPYWELPPGFLDKNNIMEAKRIMSDAEFRMEYEAAMISDSEGFFKASMLEMCTMDSGFTIELKGEPGAEYVLGIDPSQGGSASCGVVVIKISKPNKVVNVLELKLKTTQDLTQVTQTLCEIYNVARIFMDKGGGGKAIMDLLEEGYGGYEPIIDRTDKDKRNVKGRHILEMVNFNPSWISDANFTTLSMLENRGLLFPEAPLSTADVLAESYESIRDLKKQMLNIVVTQTGAGALHFDTPKKGQNKDLYSAMILAAHGVRMFTKELEEDEAPALVNSGFIREHNQNAKWGALSSKGGPYLGSVPIGKDRGLFAASLKGKRRIKK